MKKYWLTWIDSYNSEHWTKKDLRKYFPISKIEKCADGWYDCEHLIPVYAETIDHLRVKVIIYFDELGRNIDVFSVLDHTKTQRLLTEENF